MEDHIVHPGRVRWFRIALAVHVALVVATAAGAYAGVLPTSLPQVPHADLAGHAVGIGLLAMLLDGALRYRSVALATLPPPRAIAARLPLAALLVLAVAGVEEWAQRFSPRRTSCWSDFAADVAGVAVLVFLGRWLLGRGRLRRFGGAPPVSSAESSRTQSACR